MAFLLSCNWPSYYSRLQTEHNAHAEDTVAQKHLTELWRQPDFLKLWAGETVSLLGSQVTLLAMPLTAAMTLQATPLQMGALGTIQYIPWLLVGLVAGVWVDRLRRRPVMIAADLGRMVLLGLVPFAALAGILRMEHLYIVGFLVGIMNVFFDVAYTAYLPTLVERDRLVEGNSRLQVSASIAEIGGPGLAGGLVQLVTAPVAIAADALSFLVSALSLAWIGASEPRSMSTDGPGSIPAEIREGLRFVFSNPVLRAFALASVTCNFFVDVHLAVFVLYATRELGISPMVLGSVYAVGSVGGLVGSLFAGRLVRWLGLGPVIIGAQTVVTLAVLAIPLSGRQLSLAVPLIALAEALWGFAVVVYVVNTVSLRQVITPNKLQGRVTASLRFVTWGIAPPGFLLGGLLGEMIGLKATLLVAVAGPLLSVVWLLLSPVPGLREPPAPEPITSPSEVVP
jgi:MFS family permease